MNIISSDYQAWESYAAEGAHHRKHFFMMKPPGLPKKHEIKLHRILVPVDFSNAAVVAAEYAVSLSRENGSAVTLLHVMQENPPDGGRAAHDELQVFADRFWHGDKRVSVVVISGEPGAAIVRQAATIGAGLIVMTTKRHRGFLDPLRRDTMAKVVREAPCPLMVARLSESGSRWKSRPGIAA